MNSYNTDIFFSNYFNLQSVHFELKAKLRYSKIWIYIWIAVPQNGLVHSAPDIDEFVPGDELDAAFLDEDKNASRKKANKPGPEKKPAKVSVDDSEESDR